MRLLRICAALGCVVMLAGCLQNNTQRALVGAAGGAVAADAFGGNAVTGAAVGAAAGALCNQAGVNACK